MMSYSSVLTITAFTVERYIAICHPIKSQTLSNLRRAVKIICVIWVLSAVFAVPYPVHTRIYYYIQYNGTYLPESLVCSIPLQWLEQMKHVFQMSAFVFFIFPMSLITIMYILIGKALSQSDFQQENRKTDKSSTKMRARNAVIKMLVAVVVAFFCCWAPFNAQRLLTSYVSVWTPLLLDIQSILFFISGILYYIGATVNPILYNLMSKKYRMAFKRSLCRCIYSQEELLELSVKSRSVLVYSDRNPKARAPQYKRQNNKHINVNDIRRSKSGSALLSFDDTNLSRCSSLYVNNNFLTRHCTNRGYDNSRSGSPNHWRSSSPSPTHWRNSPGLSPKRSGNYLTASRDNANKNSQSLNSLIKVSSTASIISFAEVKQDIYVELNNSSSQLYKRRRCCSQTESKTTILSNNMQVDTERFRNNVFLHDR